MTQIIPNLPPEGLSVSALAERSGLSLQRTGQLVKELEDDGFVSRVPDESDGRVRRVVYTRRGRKLLAVCDEMTQEIMAEIEGILGKKRFESWWRSLEILDEALSEGEGIRIAGSR